eukprot:6180084-Pleurochrysis_carterae.AAC.1
MDALAWSMTFVGTLSVCRFRSYHAGPLCAQDVHAGEGLRESVKRSYHAARLINSTRESVKRSYHAAPQLHSLAHAHQRAR